MDSTSGNLRELRHQDRTKEEAKCSEEAKQRTNIEELSRVLDQGPAEQALQMEEAPEPTKPVNPNRIQTSEMENPVDGISPATENEPPAATGGGLLRDITPPSHA